MFTKEVVLLFAVFLILFSVSSVEAQTLPEILDPPSDKLDDSIEYDIPGFPGNIKSGGSKGVECGSTPTPGCEITLSTTFNPGVYNMSLYPGGEWDQDYAGIIINADNIVLDCNGATLVGPTIAGEYGIYSNNTKNLTIKNCKITGYGTAMVLKYVHGINLFGNKIFSDEYNQFEGIWLENSTDIIAEDNVFDQERSSWYSIKLYKGMHFLVKNNTFTENIQINNINSGAISLYSVCNATVQNNTLINNTRSMLINNWDFMYIDSEGHGRTIPTGDCDFAIIVENNSFEKGHRAITIDKIKGDSHSDLDVIIRNNDITYYNIGAIFVTSTVNDNKIYNNNFYANRWYALGIYGSGGYSPWSGYEGNNVEFYDNICIGPDPVESIDHCVYVNNGSVGPSHNNYFHDNYITDYAGGIFFNENPTAHNNIIKNNTITGVQEAIIIFNSDDIHIAENTLYDNIHIGIDIDTVNDVFVYLNNIYSNRLFNVYGAEPIELSYKGVGNYWGHSESPCFILGVDASSIIMVDSYPYCEFLDKSSIRIDFPEWGWYLFGFNNLQENSSTNAVLDSLEPYYDIIQSYINGENLQYDPSLPDFLNTLQNMYPWYGYWIKISSPPPDKLFVYGDHITGCHPLTIQAGATPKHWIGYWLEREKPTAEALSSISGSYEYVRSYKDGEWKTHIEGLPQFSDLKEFEPGLGYMIKMSNTNTLDYICN